MSDPDYKDKIYHLEEKINELEEYDNTLKAALENKMRMHKMANVIGAYAKPMEEEKVVKPLPKIEGHPDLPKYEWDPWGSFYPLRKFDDGLKDSPVNSVIEDLRKRPEQWSMISGNYDHQKDSLYNESLKVYANERIIREGMNREDAVEAHHTASDHIPASYVLNEKEKKVMAKVIERLRKHVDNTENQKIGNKLREKISDIGYI